jgi:predicted ATPase
VQMYCVLGESGAQSRLDVSVTHGLTPLVGREADIALLLERWAKAKDRQGQVVVLSGEAGIGKSRLVHELQAHAEREGTARITLRCSPYHQQSALYPVIEHLQQVLQFRRDDTPTAKLAKLEHVLRGYGLPLPEVVPLLAALLSLPAPEHYPPLQLSPQRQKQLTQAALIAWLLAEAERQPVLAVWEDLHWADPSTLEWLGLFLDQVPTARLLTLLTCRPEFHPPWPLRSHLTQLTLRRLARRHVEVMVESVAGGKTLPPEVVQQVVIMTDGVPLFVEELTKTVVEAGGVHDQPAQRSLAIPATLHDSLMARLDRLGAVKEMAQLGAVLGREFTYELLQAVWPAGETTLQQGLATLVEAELLYQRGLPPQARYLFKHALIQDAAYQALLRSTRQQYHQQIAQVLEERFAETTETQPELLAHHYTEAGFIAQAIPYWQRAGQKAIERSANVEAVGHLSRGLELLKILPDTPEHVRQELSLQIALGAPLIATRGYAAPEVEHTYARARELCRQVGDTPQLFPVLRGLWVFYEVRAEHQAARELGEQLLTLAQSLQDTALFVEAHRALGNTLFWLGEEVSARVHLEQSMALYDPQQHSVLAFLYGSDPGVICLGYRAFALWCLGYPDQALQRIHEALTLAQRLAHPHSLAFALTWAAILHWLRREGQATKEQAEAAIALATEQGFPFWVAQGTMMRGWALADQGRGKEGIAQLHEGVTAYRATGAEVFLTGWLALLAEAYGKVEQTEEGLRVVDEALTLVEKKGEQVYEAELYRLKGMLALLPKGQGLQFTVKKSPESGVGSPESEAEECFWQAIEVARRQQAKSLELRAVMSLARLWQHQGKQEEGRKLLAEVYSWFTEGFDTADLKEARALLER